MHFLRDIPIQRKLRVVILATCSAALIVACGALFGLQYFFFRRDFQRDLKAVAEMIANNSTAAITFNDSDNAREILAALRAKPHIHGAAILLKDGSIFAQTGESFLSPQVPVPEQGLHPLGNGHIYSYPIQLDGERLGTLLLRPSYRSQSNELFRLYAGLLLLVLAISFLIAVLISWRLEQFILSPIQYLAEVVQKIARRGDYTLRAQKFVEDELGSFTDSFNAMLDQIQSRDGALRHEIAERRRAEEELQRVHQQLMDASRQAGMAEVATGVLHNVGNVLNSVNVSATILAEKLGGSRTGNLVKATALLREQNGNLHSFLTIDPKGRALPGYLADVSMHLERERSEALMELDLLTRNIEHIKDIVAMQQSYACLGGLVEARGIVDLIEDSLRMNAGGFQRHNVTLVRDYEEVPLVAVDKHKVLQILVNITGNAKYAMDEADPPEKRLTIRLRRREAFVQVQVIDTGVGIPEENLTRIFSHGFTTRREGHGFGLHSAALAAQQMGGTLTAESPGMGLGATFTLEVPIASSPEHSVVRIESEAGVA